MAADTALASYYLERIGNPFTGNVRHIFCGDSYCFPSRSRIPAAVEKCATWDNRTAYTLQCDSSTAGEHWDVNRISILNAGPTQIGAGGGFAEGGSVRYPLPVHRGTEYAGGATVTDPTDRRIITWTIDNTEIAEGVGGARFTNLGDTFQCLPIVRWTSTDPVMWTTYRLHQGAETGASGVTGSFVKLAPGEACAGDTPHTVTDGVEANPTCSLAMVGADDFTVAQVDNYLTVLGMNVWTSTTGQHISILGDTSWRWSQWGVDGSEGTGDNKFFDTVRLQYWLTATNLDLNKKHVFWVHMNVESADATDESAFLLALVRLRTKFATACGAAKIANWKMLVVVPFAHTGTSLTIPQTNTALENLRDAARTAADVYPEVAVYSIYDVTEGNYFDGTATPNAWLAANGFDSFSYGNYSAFDMRTQNGGNLIPDNVHPGGQNEAAFFYHFVVDALEAESNPSPDIGSNFAAGSPLSFLSPHGAHSRA